MLKQKFTTIRHAYSGTAAKEGVAAIIQHHRIQASPGYRAAAQYVLAELQKAGLDAEIETYPANYETKFWETNSFQEWEAIEANLHLIEPDEEASLLADYRETKLSLIQRSLPFSGEAELILLEDGLVETDYEDVDVAGKVVLTSGGVERVRQLAVERFGAIGILFDGMASTPPVREAMDVPDAHQYTSFWWTGQEKQCFGFVLTPRQGYWLRNLIKQQTKAGKSVKVQANVKTRFYDGEMEVVTALIPGAALPHECAIIVSHLCHPQPSANDNATGVAANLEAARTLQKLIASGQLPPPKRSIRFLWMPEMTGTYAYLSRHEAEIPDMIAGLNLDMVGEDQNQTGSVWLLERPPAASASFAPDLLARLREALFDDAKMHSGLFSYPLFRHAIVPFSGGSDHYIFSDPTVGVPMPMFIQWPDKFYHTSADTLEKVDPASLARSGGVAAAYAYFIATAGEAEATWLAYEMLARFQARLATQTQSAITTRLKGERPSPPMKQIIDYQRDRFLAALQTLNRLWAGVGDICTAVAADTVQITSEAKSRLNRFPIGEESDAPKPDEWEEKASTIMPKRLYRGPGMAIGRLSELTPAEQDAWQGLLANRPAAHLIPVLAEYWADGRRSALAITDLIELEIGIRDAELVVGTFELLARLGLVMISQP